jgi:hypothetical protein
MCECGGVLAGFRAKDNVQDSLAERLRHDWLPRIEIALILNRAFSACGFCVDPSAWGVAPG